MSRCKSRLDRKFDLTATSDETRDEREPQRATARLLTRTIGNFTQGDRDGIAAERAESWSLTDAAVAVRSNFSGAVRADFRLDGKLKRHQARQDTPIEILHKAQELFGYLEDDVLLYVSRSLKLPPSRVYGVATFYRLFSLAPQGVHTCTVCTGTACYVKGAAQSLKEWLEGR